MAIRWWLLLLVVSSLLLVSARKFVLVLDDDESKEASELTVDKSSIDEELVQLEKTSDDTSLEDFSEWETFSDFDDAQGEDPDPGSWKQMFEDEDGILTEDMAYATAVKKLVNAVSDGDNEVLQDVIKDLQAAADSGHAHSQSTLASMYAHGYGVEKNDLKAFLYHHFAAEGGNYQSKMALAYSFFRQQMHEQSVKLYAELASSAVASFLSSKYSPLIEPVRLHEGSEENKEALKKFRGEEDDDFQFLEYQAQKGNPTAMYKIGLFYYFGLRGVRREHSKALSWFLKAVEKGDSASLELLGEIYARGNGVNKNYTKAYDYFKRALAERRFSAYNGIGYLYFNGYGVDSKNLTMAKEYYKKAAEHNDPNGYYNLGVLYLKGAGVKKSITSASKCFVAAANQGHPKAYYQLAKMQQKGIGMKKDLATAAELYKIVAERGQWGSILRWGLESYLKGEIGVSLLLYSRGAELGYEVAQSNAAWILDKYEIEGAITHIQRHQRAHTLWRHASEQGNEYAALLIGDAYYYGRGTERDLERAVEAYMRARSQRNAQAMFNIGYMHEHGLGLPVDFHLAKRYYDQALDTDPSAKLPVTLALYGLWLRQRNPDGLLVRIVDMLPNVTEWVRKLTWRRMMTMTMMMVDDGNATLITLIICLFTVLYLRHRHRHYVPPPLVNNIN